MLRQNIHFKTFLELCEELEIFIPFMYVRGRVASKGLPIFSLWSKI